MFGLAAGLDRVATIRRLAWRTRSPPGAKSLAANQKREFERETFACECSDPECREVVSMTSEERDFVRRVPSHRVVMVGHADQRNERVLMEEPGRFQVIERF
jgi:hypothetical protein